MHSINRELRALSGAHSGQNISFRGFLEQNLPLELSTSRLKRTRFGGASWPGPAAPDGSKDGLFSWGEFEADFAFGLEDKVSGEGPPTFGDKVLQQIGAAVYQ